MISPISFSSTYKVNNEDPKAFSEFQKYALNKEYKDGVRTFLKDRATRKGMDFKYKAEQTLIVPDSMDCDVETFCANNGIEYKKYTKEDLTGIIKEAPKGLETVFVDADKLEELIKSQMTNIPECEAIYYDNGKYGGTNYYNQINEMINNGEKIPATTLMINPDGDHLNFEEGNKKLKKFVNSFENHRLYKNQITIKFMNRTNFPDHCVYFALRNLGLDKIPVYVSEQTGEAGRILGLFE